MSSTSHATRHVSLRAAFIAVALALVAFVSGCGWAPLYADRDAGPVAAELREVQVAPIAERIGQNLERALRTAVDPSGAPSPKRYALGVTLQVTKQNLGITTQGLGTLGRTDVYARFVLKDIKSGKQLFAGNSHFNVSFDLLANGYSNVVAQNDSEIRVVDELRDDLLTRLIVFFRNRAAHPPPAGT
jgi:LPS-assembly lipoprotein